MSAVPLRGLAVLAMALATPAGASEVCRWKDEAGKPQFGDCRLAPTQNSRVDTRPANPQTAVPGPAGRPPPLPQIRNAPAVAASAPAGWTPACDAIARRVMALPSGTPFREEARQIEQQCPGYSFRCEFDYAKPGNNRCGAAASTEFSVGMTHRNFPRGAEKPSWRDLPPTSF